MNCAEDVSDLDRAVSSPVYLTDPRPTLRALRAAQRVHRSEVWTAWVLTRHDDIAKALRAPNHYSNAGRFSALAERFPSEKRAEADVFVRHNAVGMRQADHPNHTRLRSVISRASTHELIGRMQIRVQAMQDDLAADREPDLVDDIAYRIPLMTICELLGGPQADRDPVCSWAM